MERRYEDQPPIGGVFGVLIDMLRRTIVKPLRPGKAAGIGLTASDGDRLIQAVMNQAFRRELRAHRAELSSVPPNDHLVDLLFAGPGAPRLPDETFPRLRWGGAFACVGTSASKIQRLAEMYDNRAGFVLEQRPTHIWAGAGGLRIPGFTPKGHWFSARKTRLIQPGDITDRFTYHVELTPAADEPEGYVVTKRVPSYENICYRLHKRLPDANAEQVQARAHKLVDHIFPTFLTREAAFLKILERDLPEAFRDRVPKLIAVDKDERGFVRQLQMNWMRTGGPVLSQLEFARQAAEMLCALHDQARIIHLDLRLDNFVLTEAGVGFCDFGSAVRIGEDLDQSPMLTSLFEEMMRTSQIQKMLGRMIDRGHVTSEAMMNVHQKVDKAVDTFYLAVQINKPRTNPEFKHLITVEPDSPEARALSALTAAILRPKHPEKSEFKTAADILRGIDRIERRLAEQGVSPGKAA